MADEAIPSMCVRITGSPRRSAPRDDVAGYYITL
jgi:hypothetical protein